MFPEVTKKNTMSGQAGQKQHESEYLMKSFSCLRFFNKAYLTGLLLNFLFITLVPFYIYGFNNECTVCRCVYIVSVKTPEDCDLN